MVSPLGFQYTQGVQNDSSTCMEHALEDIRTPKDYLGTLSGSTRGCQHSQEVLEDISTFRQFLRMSALSGRTRGY